MFREGVGSCISNDVDAMVLRLEVIPQVAILSDTPEIAMGYVVRVYRENMQLQTSRAWCYDISMSWVHSMMASNHAYQLTLALHHRAPTFAFRFRHHSIYILSH
jgi:hypothetical protein